MSDPASIETVMTWLGGSAVGTAAIATALRWMYVRFRDMIEWIRPFVQKFFEAQIALIEHLKESHEALVHRAECIEKKLDTQSVNIDEVRARVEVIHGHIAKAMEASRK